MKVAGVYRLAHRIALFGVDGLANDKFACHRCDNPRCVRPSHLFAGTSRENVVDMIAKGRARAAMKLSGTSVDEIRASAGTLLEIAGRYGIATRTVARIKRRC